MPKFLTELDTREITDTTAQLLEDFKYNSDLYPGTIIVPKGFVTDFASFPIARQWAHRGAVIHDFFYQTHLVGKITADRIFLEAMKADGIWLWKRQLIFQAVLVAGWWSYHTGPRRFQVLGNLP